MSFFEEEIKEIIEEWKNGNDNQELESEKELREFLVAEAEAIDADWGLTEED